MVLDTKEVNKMLMGIPCHPEIAIEYEEVAGSGDI